MNLAALYTLAGFDRAAIAIFILTWIAGIVWIAREFALPPLVEDEEEEEVNTCASPVVASAEILRQRDEAVRDAAHRLVAQQAALASSRAHYHARRDLIRAIWGGPWADAVRDERDVLALLHAQAAEIKRLKRELKTRKKP